jgi:hypothetical protein
MSTQHRKPLTEDEANEALAMLQDEELDRAMEIAEEEKLEQLRLAGEIPRDPVFPNERGPISFGTGSIDRK